MAFTIPKLSDISAMLRGLVPSAVAGARADIWPNNWTVFVKVMAMAAAQGNLRARWIFRQVFVSSAEKDFLDLHGYQIGVGRKGASFATGEMVFVAVPGANLPAGAVIDAGGLSYTVRAPVMATGATLTVVVDAITSGPLGNLPAGAAIRLRDAWSGLAQSGVVGPDGAAGGFEAEEDQPYRRRILFAKRNKSRGGAEADYVIWCGEVPGFSGAKVLPWTPGAGIITLYPLLEGSGAARIPGLADLTRVADYIETKRPLTATVLVAQAVAKNIAVTITQLENDSAAVRAEISAEQLDMFDERSFVARTGETFPVAWIVEATSRAIGEQRHRMLLPAADVALAQGEYPVFSGLTVS